MTTTEARRVRSRQDASGYEHARAGTPLDLAWLAFALRSRWRWLAASAALGLATAMLLSSAERPTWQAEALLAPEVEVDPSDPLARQSALHAGARFLTLPSVGRAVQRALGGSVSLESVHARLESEIDREAGVIRVRARGETAASARRLATVAVTAFMDQRRAGEAARLSGIAARLSAEAGAARARLDRVRASYDAFRAAHGIDDLASDRTRAIAEAARWLAAADEESVDSAGGEARSRALRAEARHLPRLQATTTSSTDLLGAELARARTEHAGLEALYSPRHPLVIAADARIRGLESNVRQGRRALSIDVTRGGSPLRQTLEAQLSLAVADRATAREREENLRALAVQARSRVRALSEVEGQAAERLSEVRVAEARIESLRRDTAAVEDAAVEPRTGYRTLAAAFVPPGPLPSWAHKAAPGAGALVGLLLAACAVVWRARGGGLCPHTPAEFAWWAGMPVLGASRWPALVEDLPLLAAELDDHASRSRGCTLVVSARPEDRPLAEALAARLASSSQAALPPGDDLAPVQGGEEPDPEESLEASGLDEPSAREHGARTLELQASAGGVLRGRVSMSERAPSDDESARPEAPEGLWMLAMRFPLGRREGDGTTGLPLGLGQPSGARHQEAARARASVRVWTGPLEGPALRRIARFADRVIVVVPKGALSPLELARLKTRFGREDGIALVVVALGDAEAALRDRWGDVDEFWSPGET